jgi:hypothetical protein
VVLGIDLTAATAPDGPTLAEVADALLERARREVVGRFERLGPFDPASTSDR